jgi:hypothetical protein
MVIGNNMKNNIFTMKKVAGGTFAGVLMISGSANAALDGAAVTALQTEVLGDVTLAVGAGFAVLTVVLASSIGFGLLSKFINKGSNG